MSFSVRPRASSGNYTPTFPPNSINLSLFSVLGVNIPKLDINFIMEKQKIDQKNLVFVALLVVFSAVSFFAGTKYQQSKSSTSLANRNFPQMGQNGQPASGTGTRQRMGGGQVMGEIIAKDDKSITVKLTDGSSKIILLSSSTSVNKAASATITDLTVGEKVAVFGTTNTDGSVTATNVQLNPTVRAQDNGSASEPPAQPNN